MSASGVAQRPLPLLKVYGTLREQRQVIVARIGKRKRRFAFEDDDGRKRARVEAQQHLEDETRASLPCNTYSAPDVNGTCRVQALESKVTKSAQQRTFEILIDAADLDHMRDRVWWVRTRPGTGLPTYVYTSNPGTNRLVLHRHLVGVEDPDIVVRHRNANALDNRRSNIEIVRHAVDQFAPLPCSFDRFCFDDGPHIPRRFWDACKRYAEINTDHGQHIARALSDCLGARYATLPVPHYTDGELLDDVVRLEDKHESTSDNISFSNAGQRLCKHYMCDAMIECGYRLNATTTTYPFDMWRNAHDRTRICRSALRRHGQAFNVHLLWASIKQTEYLPGNFPPTAARDLIARYGGDGARILDFCSGWAGRFVGFWFAANARHYTGIDPNPRLHPRYAKMAAWLQQHCPPDTATEKTFEFLRTTAETWTRDDAKPLYDVVLTSPPYFDREVYNSTDPNQSSATHGSSYAAWLQGFMQPALRNAVDALRVGGHALINVDNTAQCPTLVDDVLTYATTALTLTHVTTLKLCIPRRPNSPRDKFEPILVLRKPNP